MALDDRGRSRPRPAGCRRRGRQSPSSREAQKASATAGSAVADQQRALQRQRHPLDQAARPRLRSPRGRRARREARRRRRPGGGSPRGASSISAKKASSDSGLSGHRPQHVEALDVARSLPDRVERRLAVEARHPGLLDVAVAAQALQRLDRVDRRALAGPVLEHRGREPPEQRLAARRRREPRRRRAPAASRRSSPPRTRSRGRRARCASAAGRSAACRTRERWLAWWIACAVPQRIPAAGADHAVEPGVVDHLDDRRHAAALLADQPRPGAARTRPRSRRSSGCRACP